MPKDIPKYEEIFLNECRKNHSLVRDEVAKKEPGMMRKIKTHCDRSGHNFDDVVRKISDDPMFAYFFTKDPAKQNLYENLASEYIKSIEFISNYKKLPNAGNDALYVINGSIIDGKTRAMTGGATDAKSIEFLLGMRGEEVLCVSQIYP